MFVGFIISCQKVCTKKTQLEPEFSLKHSWKKTSHVVIPSLHVLRFQCLPTSPLPTRKNPPQKKTRHHLRLVLNDHGGYCPNYRQHHLKTGVVPMEHSSNTPFRQFGIVFCVKDFGKTLFFTVCLEGISSPGNMIDVKFACICFPRVCFGLRVLAEDIATSGFEWATHRDMRCCNSLSAPNTNTDF